MIRSFRCRLIPTKEQEAYFWKATNTARWAYNFAIEQSKSFYETYKTSIYQLDIRKYLTQLKKESEYTWINEVSNNVTKQAIKDSDKAYQSFFKKTGKYPRFKSKRHSKPSFYTEVVTFNISKGTNEVRIDNFEKLGWIQISEEARRSKYLILTAQKIKICNPRISHDGLYWNLSFSVDMPETYFKKPELKPEVLGIDVGIKSTAVCSDKSTYENINATDRLKHLEKRRKHLQQILSNKYEQNNKVTPDCKYRKTNNIRKLERKILRLNRHLTNIRNNRNHQLSREIVNKNYEAISLETLNIKKLMSNKYQAKEFQDQALYQLKTFITYKAESQGERVIEVSRWYRSTQTCSKCRSIKPMPTSIRTYKCPHCGLEIDRDLNSAYNLAREGLSKIQEEALKNQPYTPILEI